HFGVVRTERLLPDRQSALVQPFSLAVLAFSPSGQAPTVESLSCSRGHALGFCLLLFVAALLRRYRGQIRTGRGHVGMARSQGLLPNHQGTLEEPLRLRVLPLVSIYSCQVVERLPPRRLGRPKSLPPDRQCALVEFLRLSVLPLVRIDESQVVEAFAHCGVIRTKRCFADRQRALEEPLR